MKPETLVRPTLQDTLKKLEAVCREANLPLTTTLESPEFIIFIVRRK